MNNPSRHFILTISARDNVFQPTASILSRDLVYVRGQLELGESGFLHWQLVASFSRAIRRSAVLRLFPGGAHVEPTRSEAARDYVWKQDTRVDGTQFEFGQLPFRRNNKRDWDAILDSAKNGNLTDIDAATLVTHYGNLKRIQRDHLRPTALVRSVYVYWGATGTGKSRLAWDNAGFDAFPKDPR